MNLSLRFRAAFAAGLKHMLVSLVVAAAAAGLVFLVWYPYPYRDISGGRELFLLVIRVDVVVGPLLTLMVYDPRKPTAIWRRDLAVILALQLAALAYGLYSVAEARPVRLVFEGNRFRVVTLAELDMSTLTQAPEELRAVGLGGPVLIGARMAQATDPDFTQSVRASIEGLPPSLRPSRWVAYQTLVAEVRANAKPLDALLRKYPAERPSVEQELTALGVPPSDVGVMPLVSRTHDDWATLIDLRRGTPLTHVHLDAW